MGLKFCKIKCKIGLSHNQRPRTAVQHGTALQHTTPDTIVALHVFLLFAAGWALIPREFVCFFLFFLFFAVDVDVPVAHPPLAAGAFPGA